MVDKIETSTNGKVEETLAGLLEDVLQDTSRSYIRTTGQCEMYTLFRLMYFRGLLGLNQHHMINIFQRELVIRSLVELCQDTVSPFCCLISALMPTETGANSGRRTGSQL